MLKQLSFFAAVACIASTVSCSSSLSSRENEIARQVEQVLEKDDVQGWIDLPMSCEWSYPLFEQGGNAVVFFVDSSCSMCILDYVKAVLEVCKIPGIDCIGIVNDDQQEIVRYYSSLSGLPGGDSKRIRLIAVPDCFPYGMEGRSFVFFLRNGKMMPLN